MVPTGPIYAPSPSSRDSGQILGDTPSPQLRAHLSELSPKGPQQFPHGSATWLLVRPFIALVVVPHASFGHMGLSLIWNKHVLDDASPLLRERLRCLAYVWGCCSIGTSPMCGFIGGTAGNNPEIVDPGCTAKCYRTPKDIVST